MASSKEYLEFILDQYRELEGISYRPMMGEYVFYYKGVVFGGIYDDRFLVKPLECVKEIMPNAKMVIPYPGSKGMLSVTDVDDIDLLIKLAKAVYEELTK